MAGPDGRDEYVRDIPLGDEQSVQLNDLTVLVVEDLGRFFG